MGILTDRSCHACFAIERVSLLAESSNFGSLKLTIDCRNTQKLVEEDPDQQSMSQ
jgi:hypothetical protein